MGLATASVNTRVMVCAFIEKCGLSFVGHHRMVLIQAFGTFLMLCAMTFFIVGCFGLSTAEPTMKNVSWTKFHTGGTVDFYLNLAGIGMVQRTTGAWSMTKWDDIDADALGLDKLSDCKDASMEMRVTIIISAITAALNMSLCFTRGSVNKDNGCWKLTSIITGLIALISHLIALGSYAHNCYENAPSGGREYAVGFILPLTATIMAGVVWILFCLCPCPDMQDGAHPSPKSSGRAGDGEAVETVQNPTHRGKSKTLEYSMEEVSNDKADPQPGPAVPSMQTAAPHEDEEPGTIQA